MLCEGQSSVFLSLPSGEVRALPLDSDFQAKFFPATSGPHTFQCGKETATVAVFLPKPADSGAYSSGENMFLVAGVAIAFLAALLIAAKAFLKPRTIFSKSGGGGRVLLFLRAGEDLQGITIYDPQGGENGQPLKLLIPRLPSGAEWRWEYESSGGPLLDARLEAKCANGAVSIISDTGHSGVPKQKMAGKSRRENRKLAKHSC